MKLNRTLIDRPLPMHGLWQRTHDDSLVVDGFRNVDKQTYPDAIAEQILIRKGFPYNALHWKELQLSKVVEAYQGLLSTIDRTGRFLNSFLNRAGQINRVAPDEHFMTPSINRARPTINWKRTLEAYFLEALKLLKLTFHIKKRI